MSEPTSGLDAMFTAPQISTDSDDRHWDEHGREYRAVVVDGEVTFELLLADDPAPRRAPLVFLDTETTGVYEDDEVWEIAAVRRESDGSETELHLFVAHDVRKVLRLPQPFRIDWATRYTPAAAVTKDEAALELADFLLGPDPAANPPVIVGANPSFDIAKLRQLCAEHLDSDVYPDGLPMHYRPVDVGALAYGYLSARAAFGAPDEETLQLLERRLPWSSDEVSRALGIDPADFERHTAMGDVRWVMAMYDRITGGPR